MSGAVHRAISRYRQRRKARHNRSPAPISAVYDDDLWSILSDLDLLESLDHGELACPVTGVVLTRENVGGIIVKGGRPWVVSEDATNEATR